MSLEQLQFFFFKFTKYLFLALASLSTLLLGYLCITNHKYTYYLFNVAVPSDIANLFLFICILISILLYFQPVQWKENNRWFTLVLSFIFFPFQWLGVNIALIEYGLKDEFVYKFGVFRIERVWTFDQKISHATTFLSEKGISIPDHVLNKIVATQNKFSSIDNSIIEHYNTTQEKLKGEATIGIIGNVKEWISIHPWATAGIVVLSLVVVGGITYYLVTQNDKFDKELDQKISNLFEEKVTEINKTCEEVKEIVNTRVPNEKLQIAKRMDDIEKETASSVDDINDRLAQLQRRCDAIGSKVGSESDEASNTLSLLQKRVEQLEDLAEKLRSTSVAVAAQTPPTVPVSDIGFGIPSASSVISSTKPSLKAVSNPNITRLSDQPLSELAQLKIRIQALEGKVGNSAITGLDDATTVTKGLNVSAERLGKLDQRADMLRSWGKNTWDEHRELAYYAIPTLENILKFLLIDDSQLPGEKPSSNIVPTATELTQVQLREQLKSNLEQMITLWEQFFVQKK